MVRSASPSARQDHIKDLLLAHGSVRSDELSTLLDVSLMTIHRDLDTLAEQGWLRKVHGGATLQRAGHFELNVRARLRENERLKRAVAVAALSLIGRGDAVILDDSTATLAMAEGIAEIGAITLVTNFRRTMDAVAGVPGVELIGLGGQYHSAYDSFFGSTTAAAVGDLSADLAFVSASAVAGGQCFHPLPESIEVKRAMLNATSRRVLVIDHSKLRKRALHRFCALSDFDTVVIDAETPAEDLDALAESGVELVVAPLLA